MKQRVELPGEVAAQLNQMREENAHFARLLDEERGRVSRLLAIVKNLTEVMGKAWPGQG